MTHVSRCHTLADETTVMSHTSAGVTNDVMSRMSAGAATVM